MRRMVEAQPVPGKHCGRNAYRHIRCAWRLEKIDREMAAFRAITAEEESTAAVFHALRRRRYPGAERLDPRSHVHKNALQPFLWGVWKVVTEVDRVHKLAPRVFADVESDPPRMRIALDAGNLVGASSGGVAFPEPPLDFSIRKGAARYDFGKHLDEIASERSAKTILDFVRERANKRNRLLYATSQGMPAIEALNDFLPLQRNRVNANLAAFLLIDQYPQKQSFAQQALDAFLRMLKRLPEDVDFG